jgi:hypothetical protein
MKKSRWEDQTTVDRYGGEGTTINELANKHAIFPPFNPERQRRRLRVGMPWEKSIVGHAVSGRNVSTVT